MDNCAAVRYIINDSLLVMLDRTFELKEVKLQCRRIYGKTSHPGTAPGLGIRVLHISQKFVNPFASTPRDEQPCSKQHEAPNTVATEREVSRDLG